MVKIYNKVKKTCKKVCIITCSDPPLDSRVFYKEAKSLKKFGYDVTVIAPSVVNEMQLIDGINIIEIKEFGPRLIRWFLLLIRIFRRSLKVHADIYHCHDPDLFPVTALLRILKKNVIYEVREYYPDVISITTLPMKFYLIFTLSILEPLFCKFFNVIITTDEGIAKRYKKFNNNVHPIFNFPSFDVFKPLNNQDMKMKYEDYFVIIYVGGMSEERGILELLKAVHKVSETHPLVKLLLLGNFGSRDFEDKCTGYVKLNDLNENVDFLGFVTHTEIPKYIGAADVGTVLLHPTTRFIKTAYPIKLFEYMICGKPVIASNLPAMGEIVKNAGCGILVNPINIEEIAEAIVSLIEHPEEAKRMCETGRRAVEEKYNWNEMEKELIKIYNTIRGIKNGYLAKN